MIVVVIEMSAKPIDHSNHIHEPLKSPLGANHLYRPLRDSRTLGQEPVV